ncbi:hypothetical protein [Nonomuraea dietziae]|uniref:hypothetical protein n=1 Tax=Nonomuraea dietziae TaxID=65515 RepID=UPI0033D722D3
MSDAADVDLSVVDTAGGIDIVVEETGGVDLTVEHTTALAAENRTVISGWADTEAGIGWRLSAWLYSPAGHPRAGVALSWYDADGERIDGVSDLRPLPAGTWTQYSLAVEAPSVTAQVYAQVSWRSRRATPQAASSTSMTSSGQPPPVGCGWTRAPTCRSRPSEASSCSARRASRPRPTARDTP